MKICPSCQRTYADDAQRFCLQDGTPLVSAAQPGAGAGYTPAPQPAGFQPPPPPYAAGPPPGAPPSSPPPRKRKIWPWVLGGVLVLGLGGLLLLGGIGYLIYRNADTDANLNVRASRGTNARANTSRSEGPGGSGGGSSTAGMKSYTNSRANFTGKLAEHYADFSFSYPASWQLDPEAGKGDNPNFIKVERALGTGKAKMTQENFAVGWFTSTGTMEGDRALFPQLAEQLSEQFGQNFPNYEKLSEGETTVGSYSGYEFRFKSSVENTPRGDVDIFGRAVMLPSGSTSQRNGVVLIMLATSVAPEIETVDDVGVKGELPVILNSFRLGQ